MSLINNSRLLSGLRLTFNRRYSNETLTQSSNVYNRNPRNLELMRIARKQTGFHVDKIQREYWHRLKVVKSTRFITLEVRHIENGIVVSASTQEWPIKKQLYNYRDSCAYKNIGRILAQRCLESGIMFVENDPEIGEHSETKVFLALNELEKGGVTLKEPSRYTKPNPWDRHRPEKPWEVTEN